MKQIVDYIQEKLKVNSQSKIVKDHRKYFKREDENDEWTNKCLEALKDKYGYKYTIQQVFTGSICFYPKGKKPSLKNLVCCIYGLYDDKLSSDFGPNENLKSTLGKEIEDIIKSV